MTLDKVVCTPHLGAATEEAQENVATAIAEQVVDYLVHGVIRHAVNFPSIPPEQVLKVKPYLSLAELSEFASQVFEGAVTEITTEYRGEASEISTAPINVALLKGFLTSILEETVNYVNAPVIAKERGIKVKETKSNDAGDYQSMIILRVRTDGKENSLAGTLFSRKDPRIVKINNFDVEIIPKAISVSLQ